jgi:hypothetical protein
LELALVYDAGIRTGSPVDTEDWGAASSWIKGFTEYAMGEAQTMAVEGYRAFAGSVAGGIANGYVTSGSAGAGFINDVTTIIGMPNMANQVRRVREADSINLYGPEYFSDNISCHIYGQASLFSC